MGTPSRQLSDRYKLSLHPEWIEWFDRECEFIQPAGAIRSAVSAEALCAPAPPQIWAGFMLPDTLPIVGNDYGDWICARVGKDGQFEELIYWYHGGGDWVPVGRCLAEALLHDAVDQFRFARSQTLRGATEASETNTSEVMRRFEATEFRSWIARQASSAHGTEQKQAKTLFDSITRCLNAGRRKEALRVMYSQGWAVDAVACDLIELVLQEPLEKLSHNTVAEKAGIRWYPDYSRLLFDTGSVPEPTRERILNGLEEDVDWPTQDWSEASRVAQEVMHRRRDLGWAFTVAGWHNQRSGDVDQAVATYWDGRNASSFADQSVRLNSHSLAEQSGKFSIEQLLASTDRLDSSQLEDPYFAAYRLAGSQSIMKQVHQYWWDEGTRTYQDRDFVNAYEFFYRSGWDLGVSRLTDYVRILKALAECAKAAGWEARARVAETHLACLQRH